MDDNDPDALEAFIQYLYTSATMHIPNWKISYESVIKYKERVVTRRPCAADILAGRQIGELPPGYLPWAPGSC